MIRPVSKNVCVAMGITAGALACAALMAYFKEWGSRWTIGLAAAAGGMTLLSCACRLQRQRDRPAGFAPPETLLPADSMAPPTEERVIRINGRNAYERGLNQGRLLRTRIQALFRLVCANIENRESEDYRRLREQTIPHLPEEIQNEMLGIAEGAGVSVEQVTSVQTILELNAQQFGCSALAIDRSDTAERRGAATNHFRQPAQMAGLDPSEYSGRMQDVGRAPTQTSARRNQLSSALIDSPAAAQAVIRTPPVLAATTIQSVVMDAANGDLLLARGADATTDWEIHDNPLGFVPLSRDRVQLSARNLDWPWAELAEETIVAVTDPGNGRFRYVHVGWPGYLGVLTGMNEHRLRVTYCQVAGSTQLGVPVGFVIRRLLEESRTVADALTLLGQLRIFCPGNLLIAGTDGVTEVAIDPFRAPMGFAASHTAPSRELTP